MGSKNTTKQIKPILLKDVIAEAEKKYPGYNRATALLNYYRLLVKIQNQRESKATAAKLTLLVLFMNGIEYFTTEAIN